MKRRPLAGLLAATLLMWLHAGAASAAPMLTITPDQATYFVGDTITLSISGDADGGADIGIFGDLRFDPLLATGLTSEQVALTSNGGANVWLNGALPILAGQVIVFNMIAIHDFPNPVTVDGPLSATVTLRADAVGSLSFAWATSPASQALDFFGLTNAAGATVRIVERAVPEPTGAVVFGAGLLVMGWAGRRRR